MHDLIIHRTFKVIPEAGKKHVLCTLMLTDGQMIEARSNSCDQACWNEERAREEAYQNARDAVVQLEVEDRMERARKTRREFSYPAPGPKWPVV